MAYRAQWQLRGSTEALYGPLFCQSAFSHSLNSPWHCIRSMLTRRIVTNAKGRRVLNRSPDKAISLANREMMKKLIEHRHGLHAKFQLKIVLFKGVP